MASKLSISTTLPLPNSSARIPQLGFGVYQSSTSVCVRSCLTAIKAGYRHIDSAQLYRNEAEVGQAITQSGIPRAQLFVTTKMMSPRGGVDETYSAILSSVQKIGGGSSDAYSDLFLIHTAGSGKSGRRTLWLALERAFKEGKSKSIGVSNFNDGHIEEMREYATVWPPHVNQIELHPWCQQPRTVEYCQRHGIVVEAYCPIVRNQKARDPTLRAIADKHGTSPNQVLIRWSLQRGFVPLPKSDTESRIIGNADVFGFELDEEDMSNLNSLDQGRRGSICQAVE